jgi:hypothetical protein
VDSVQIEKQFFGAIDRNGHRAVEYFANFAYPWDGGNPLVEMMLYMSTQKLRTPKGLAWLREVTGAEDQTQILAAMHRSARRIYSGAIEGRPESAYNSSRSGLRDCNTASVTLRTPRSGWSAGTRFFSLAIILAFGTVYYMAGPAHQWLGPWANFDFWHSDHTAGNSVIIPSRDCVRAVGGNNEIQNEMQRQCALGNPRHVTK